MDRHGRRRPKLLRLPAAATAAVQAIQASSRQYPFHSGQRGQYLLDDGRGYFCAMHQSDRLWKIFHQMHHSAERLDTYGAFYFSPFDRIGFTVLGTVCFSFIAGMPAQSITIILLGTNFLSIFQHANIKTPVWLVYIVQHPESHAVHHGRGIHAYNYSDLPLFDILFGTFRNPESYVPQTGFYKGASSRITDMLLCKDGSAKVAKHTSRSKEAGKKNQALPERKLSGSSA
jgi:hypothetical protein